MVVPCEFEQARMEADEISLPFEHGRLEVVVEQRARHAAERVEGADVAPHEAFESLIEGESRVHGARPAKDHDEARERPLGVADDDGPEAAPVDLTLRDPLIFLGSSSDMRS